MHFCHWGTFNVRRQSKLTLTWWQHGLEACSWQSVALRSRCPALSATEGCFSLPIAVLTEQSLSTRGSFSSHFFFFPLKIELLSMFCQIQKYAVSSGNTLHLTTILANQNTAAFFYFSTPLTFGCFNMPPNQEERHAYIFTWVIYSHSEKKIPELDVWITGYVMCVHHHWCRYPKCWGLLRVNP